MTFAMTLFTGGGAAALPIVLVVGWLIGLMMGLSAAAKLIGGKRASDSAKKAAKIQDQAAVRAFAAQKAEWERVQKINAPFMEGMAERRNTMRSLTTPGTSYQHNPQPQGPPPPPPQGPPGGGPGGPPPQGGPGGPPQRGGFGDRFLQGGVGGFAGSRGQKGGPGGPPGGGPGGPPPMGPSGPPPPGGPQMQRPGQGAPERMGGMMPPPDYMRRQGMRG